MISTILLSLILTLPPNNSLLDAIRQVESGNRNMVTSPKGARGPYQIMESTWKDRTSRPFAQAYDPSISRQIACKQLEWIEATLRTKRGSASLEDILACYNAGIGRFQKSGYNLLVMPKETQNYVQKVKNLLKDWSEAASLLGVCYSWQRSLTDARLGIYVELIDQYISFFGVDTPEGIAYPDWVNELADPYLDNGWSVNQRICFWEDMRGSIEYSLPLTEKRDLYIDIVTKDERVKNPTWRVLGTRINDDGLFIVHAWQEPEDSLDFQQN